MKISIIGAGNVGSLAAMRLAQEGVGEIFLIDILKGVAEGKSLDLEDARSLLKLNYQIHGSEEISDIKDSDIIVITAGLARKPGMTREELLLKNSGILKNISLEIKKSASGAIVIVVTNPLDLMTYLVLKASGLPAKKVLGMGISLDAARFANIISQELKIPITDIDAWVIGNHGEGMLPLVGLTKINGVSLDEVIDDKKAAELTERTIKRGAQILSLLGSGSAFFAPSAAINFLVKVIAKNEKRTVGVCAYLNGEYGIKDTCIGVPCRLGREGIEEIIELELSKRELGALRNSAESLRRLSKELPI